MHTNDHDYNAATWGILLFKHEWLLNENSNFPFNNDYIIV